MNKDDRKLKTAASIAKAIRQANQIGRIWEPICMPLRTPSMSYDAVRKRIGRIRRRK